MALRSIVYFCPATSQPTGGIKIILRQSQTINALAERGVKSSVMFPGNLGFKPSWLAQSATLRRDNTFDRASDLIVIPEIWALKYGERLITSGLRFAIFVQGGFLIFSDSRPDDTSRVRRIYAHAMAILTTSEEIRACLRLAFPELSDKLLDCGISIDEALFTPAVQKEKRISYMPRRLSSHSEKVLGFLYAQPSIAGWTFDAVSGVSEIEVARRLGRSQIFLSFSELEGFALPPLEAALCGNIVIGYTGEGAKEYWMDPVFAEVPSGDIRTFVAAILSAATCLENPNSDPRRTSAYRTAITSLKSRYGRVAERAKLQSVVATLATLSDTTQPQGVVRVRLERDQSHLRALAGFARQHLQQMSKKP